MNSINAILYDSIKFPDSKTQGFHWQGIKEMEGEELISWERKLFALDFQTELIDMSRHPVDALDAVESGTGATATTIIEESHSRTYCGYSK